MREQGPEQARGAAAIGAAPVGRDEELLHHRDALALQLQGDGADHPTGFIEGDPEAAAGRGVVSGDVEQVGLVLDGDADPALDVLDMQDQRDGGFGMCRFEGDDARRGGGSGVAEDDMMSWFDGGECREP